MKIKLRCVKIVRDESCCVDCRANCKIDNAEFPELIPEIDDECDSFVVAPNGRFWPVAEFFHMNEITALEVDHEELLPKGRPWTFWENVLTNPPEPGNLFPRG